MKKILVLALICTFVSCIFASCKAETNAEITTTDEGITEVNAESISETTTLSEFESMLEENSTEVKPIDFEYPKNIKEAEKFNNLPEYDNSKKEGSSESFYSNNTVVMKKTYDSSSRLSNITVYEKDGITSKTVIDFIHSDEQAVQITEYTNGVDIKETMYTFDADGGIITGLAIKVKDDSGSVTDCEIYKFDSDGNPIKYISYQDIANLYQIAANQALGGMLS